MATVTPPTRRNLADDQVRIYSPLGRLRKYIRTYVSLEGVAVVGLFLALWFWIGMVLDYGVFKVFLFDWVQELPWGLRLGVLVVLLSGLVALLTITLALRLFRQFTDSAMALLLERRFPELLGDRLITAVELADPKVGEQYGYSRVLIHETIHEAADRVGKVPVTEVFDWKRLIVRGIALVLLTGVLYAIVGAGFCFARALDDEPEVMDGFGDFNEVAGIWAERNLLLRNIIWPRRAHLEILPWREDELSEGGKLLQKGELSIPHGSSPPTLRVRAWKYVIADSATTEGWRLLTWADLLNRPELARGESVPSVVDSWSPRDPDVGMTVDEVDLLVRNNPIVRAGQGDAVKWQLTNNEEDGSPQTLMWSDLTRDRLAGLTVPRVLLGADGVVEAPGPALFSGAIGIGPAGPLAAAGGLALPSDPSVDDVAKKLKEMKAAGKEDKIPAGVQRVIERLEQIQDIRETCDRVDTVASRREMRRTMRKLTVPSKVVLTYTKKSKSTTDIINMTPTAGHLFTANIGELKDSITFNVRGEDYVTPNRNIRVVERPRVESLKRTEERPAYLYYRPSADLTAIELRALRQPFVAGDVILSGDVTTVEVPKGTTITLTFQVSKPLVLVWVAPDGSDIDKKNFKAEDIEEVGKDKRGFSIKLPEVHRNQRFRVVFTDEDGVGGERPIVVVPRDDVAPRIRDFRAYEAIRRGRPEEGLIVAVDCRVPFSGRVFDDYGLSRVRFGCTVVRSDFRLEQSAWAGINGVGAFPLLAPHASPLLGLAYLTRLTQQLDERERHERGTEQIVKIPAFDDAIEFGTTPDGEREKLPRSEVMSRLEIPLRDSPRKLLREFILTPDGWLDRVAEKKEHRESPKDWLNAMDSRRLCDLPLWELTWQDTRNPGADRKPAVRRLREIRPGMAQQQFEVEVRLLAEDTYLEGDVDSKGEPISHLTPSGETFTFVVVPENELLGRISEEEALKFDEMDKAHKALEDRLARLREVYFGLGDAGKQEENTVKAHLATVMTVTDVLMASQREVRGVHTAYERIIREMRVNQVRVTKMEETFKGITLPLRALVLGYHDRVKDQNMASYFEQTQDAVLDLRKGLEELSAGLSKQPKGAKGPVSGDLAARLARTYRDAGVARTQLNNLCREIDAVKRRMEGLSSLERLRKEVRRLEEQQRQLENVVKNVLILIKKRELEGDGK